jgi:hypothetical protein
MIEDNFGKCNTVLTAMVAAIQEVSFIWSPLIGCSKKQMRGSHNTFCAASSKIYTNQGALKLSPPISAFVMNLEGGVVGSSEKTITRRDRKGREAKQSNSLIFQENLTD